MNMNEIPTPESDDCYNKCVLTPGHGNGLVMRSKMRDLERRLAIARGVLKDLEAAGVEGGVEDDDHYMVRIRETLTLTAPKP